ncbi:MAG: hypothetical protein FRX48_05785 [Lasallia pustulata]|uniref:Uncharacterized protein n=1 Tax=Lasallia pustulata TaxID=136370 RepID=A0A5M8PNU3_9LECA|nr:MAG: hypothetical protein FRX48_05785 [Lasallia pustulata]
MQTFRNYFEEQISFCHSVYNHQISTYPSPAVSLVHGSVREEIIFLSIIGRGCTTPYPWNITALPPDSLPRDRPILSILLHIPYLASDLSIHLPKPNHVIP